MDLALVSDAGTPGISDPGFRIIRLALENGIRVVPVPGPSALVSALVASGLPSDEFFFGGFLPARSSQRRARLEEVARIQSTLIFYEAPHRIAESLRDARDVLGEREAVIARELTKLHEEVLRGTLTELIERLEAAGENVRGEMVLMIDRKVLSTANAGTRGREIGGLVTSLEADGLDSRAALKQAAKQLGISRDEAYRRLTLERSRKKT
jgi:16S rRNA (cytidine1402-2'-O)-methyltransferase